MPFVFNQRYRFFCGVGSVLFPIAQICLFNSVTPSLWAGLPTAIQISIITSHVFLVGVTLALVFFGMSKSSIEK